VRDEGEEGVRDEGEEGMKIYENPYTYSQASAVGTTVPLAEA